MQLLDAAMRLGPGEIAVEVIRVGVRPSHALRAADFKESWHAATEVVNHRATALGTVTWEGQSTWDSISQGWHREVWELEDEEWVHDHDEVCVCFPGCETSLGKWATDWDRPISEGRTKMSATKHLGS